MYVKLGQGQAVATESFLTEHLAHTTRSILALFSTCEGGFWHCTKKDCPAMCSITNFHMKTYDGVTYKFQGTCDYVLSKDAKNRFAIIMENVKCKRTASHVVDSCGKNVKLATDGGSIELVQKKVALFNGFKVKLPFLEGGILIKEVCNLIISTFHYFRLCAKAVTPSFMTYLSS